MTLFVNFWNLVVESAPWLLLGFFLAGVIKQLIPARWIQQQLADPGLVSVIKGAFIGAPLPLCSCGVIPAALAVRKAGASKGATSSFMVATPETGVDSIAFSYAILGPVFAIARPAGALVSAIIAGILVRVMDTEETPPPKVEHQACCGSEPANGNRSNRKSNGLFGERLRSVFQYGFGSMIIDTAKWLAIGLIAAAVITTFVPPSFLLRWGDGLVAMLMMVVVGLPMYICATASTPIAASLLFAGLSPGAALVFLLTGPATNIATIGVIREHLGMRSLIAYLVGVIMTAIACGLLLNQLFTVFEWPLRLDMTGAVTGHAMWQNLTAVVLVVLVLRVWIKPWIGFRGDESDRLQKSP